MTQLGQACAISALATLLDRARTLSPLIAERAATVEAERRLGDDTLALLEEAGLFAMLVPRALGGGGSTIIDLFDVLDEIGRSCGSTAWVAHAFAIGGWLASLAPEALRQELFANGVPRISGVGTPPGHARSVPGGIRLSGRWGYASGSLHADWLFLSATLPAGEEGSSRFGSVAVPRADILIVDDWHFAGMAGTGSNSIVADDLFVPAHRIVSLAATENAASGIASARPASDFWPLWPIMIVTSMGPIVGMARRALAEVRFDAGRRGLAATRHARRSDSEVFRHELGEAAIRIDAAAVLAIELARTVDVIGADRRTALGLEERARFRAYSGFVAQQLRDAMEQLLSLAGSSALTLSSPVQRAWRDLAVLTRHATRLPSAGYELYGHVLLGGMDGFVTPNF